MDEIEFLEFALEDLKYHVKVLEERIAKLKKKNQETSFTKFNKRK